jgi:hypothetical protein
MKSDKLSFNIYNISINNISFHGSISRRRNAIRNGSIIEIDEFLLKDMYRLLLLEKIYNSILSLDL